MTSYSLVKSANLNSGKICDFFFPTSTEVKGVGKAKSINAVIVKGVEDDGLFVHPCVE